MGILCNGPGTPYGAAGSHLHVALDRAQLFATLHEMGAERQSSDPEAVAEFSDACDGHTDYLWDIDLSAA